MGSRYKELNVLVLDVGPYITPYIPHLRCAVLTFLHSKLPTTPSQCRETAIVLFGTRGTKNLIHTDAVAQDPANADQYTNIVDIVNMQKTNFAMMKSLDDALNSESITQGQGTPADFVEALIVGWDLIHRSFLENRDREKYATKRLIIISNFLSPTNEGADEQLGYLSSKFLEFNASMEAISLDIASDEVDPGAHMIKSHNNELLDMLSTQITMKLRSVTHAEHLRGIFPISEHLVTATYASTNLCLGDKLKIPVKLAIKAKQEKCPSLGKESPLSRGEGAAGSGGGGGGSEGGGGDGDVEEGGEENGDKTGINKITEYYRAEDKDQEVPVPPEEMVRAYRYGIEVVPMDETEIAAATYEPPDAKDGALKILGFTTGDGIPRYYFKESPLTLVANKDKSDAPTAFAAIVNALHQAKKVVILRFVYRKSVRILMGLPVQATGRAPAHFICNFMPFQEDIRDFKFPTLKKEERRPSEGQQNAAVKLIDAMPLHRPAAAVKTAAVDLEDTINLTGSSLENDTKPVVLPPIKEDLVPETTANPVLNRFVNYFIEKALHADKISAPPDPDDDPLLQRILSQDRLDTMPDAKTAGEAFKTQCPTGHAAKALQKPVRRLRPGQEKEDFTVMMQQGNYQDGISAMRKHVDNIIETSIGDTRYPDALSALQVLREQCLVHHRAVAFNKQMEYLKTKYARDTTRGGIWELMCKQRVGLITAEEYGGVVEEKKNAVKGDGGGASGGGIDYRGVGLQQQALPSKEAAATWMGCDAAPEERK